MIAERLKEYNNCTNQATANGPCGATLYQEVEIFAIFAGHVYTPDWREILHGQADRHAPRSCQISHELVQRVACAG